jgi:hypothetical protein
VYLLQLHFVVAVAVHPPTPVTVTVYVPVAFTCALLITGLDTVEEKPLGPVQEKLIPLVTRLSCMFPLTQTGELDVTDAVGWLTDTLAVPVPVQPVAISVAVTVYVVWVAGVTNGFGSVEVNPAGLELQA